MHIKLGAEQNIPVEDIGSQSPPQINFSAMDAGNFTPNLGVLYLTIFTWQRTSID